jgi:hypothetical protein
MANRRTEISSADPKRMLVLTKSRTPSCVRTIRAVTRRSDLGRRPQGAGLKTERDHPSAATIFRKSARSWGVMPTGPYRVAAVDVLGCFGPCRYQQGTPGQG